MTRRRLDNQAWGFRSNCFVCEPKNAGGLRIPFFLDEDAGLVVADYTLEDTFSGPPHYVHGGITMAILDEAMAWATIALAHSFALTCTSTCTFRRAVKVGQRHRVEAGLTARTGDRLHMAAVVLDEASRTCAEATAEFVAMTPEQAGAAIGEVGPGDAGFVRADR